MINRNWRWWSDPPPEEVIRDREALLKYELILIQTAYMEEANLVTKELAQIQGMKLSPHEFTKIVDDFANKVWEQVSETNDFIRECKKIPR